MLKKTIKWNFDKPISLLKWNKIHTVCEESRCPNRFECSQEGIATYLIGGRVCTRSCNFCNIETGRPSVSMSKIMEEEQQQIVSSIKQLNNSYVVITSVARDDDELLLAQHFANITNILNQINIEVELLIPDFHLREDCLEVIANSKPIVLAHNIETVRELSHQVRPQARYERSLKLHHYFHKHSPNLILKAGMMIGLGENMQQIKTTLLDLKDASVEIVTVGQYLQPSKKQMMVKEHIEDDIFLEIEEFCREIGFLGYEVGPFVRSSYMASRTMEQVKIRKYQKLLNTI